jgi:hypothetical protein
MFSGCERLFPPYREPVGPLGFAGRLVLARAGWHI